MRGRSLLVGLVVTSAAVAQPPRLLPPAQLPMTPAVGPSAVQAPGPPKLPTPPVVPLPRAEGLVPIDPGAMTPRRAAGGGWQVWSNARVFKDTGADEAAAREVVRVLRDLRPTDWAAIGTPRPVVEYGLVGGKPPAAVGFPRQVVSLDLASARVEQVRGAWCLRDDANLVLNFGPHQADADQALAVARRYGFNRVGAVGPPPNPAMTYFFAAPPASAGEKPAVNPLAAVAQEQGLTRTGVAVPGVGYVGESLKIDPRKVEARRDGGEWVVAHGADVLARFGPAEWHARDAARAVQDGRFTEFCRVGSGLTFFLVNGQPPARVSLARVSRTFEPAGLAVKQYGGRWAVVEPNPRTGADKPLFDVADAAEGELVVRLVRHYKFDQLCQAGGGGLTFLARSR